MVVKVKYDNGKEEDINLSIFVNDNDHDLSNVNTSTNNNSSFLKAIWDAIVLFFTNTWNWFMNVIVNPIINLFK